MNAVDRHVFVSYSHRDATWLERLRIHLRSLVHRATLEIWDDSRISVGQDWRKEIATAIGRAHVAVLLISADFLASDFVVQNELPPILHRAGAGLLIVPVIVGPCLFEEHQELSRYQSANAPNRPLLGLTPTDAEGVMLSVARSIGRYFHHVDATRSAAPAVRNLESVAVASSPPEANSDGGHASDAPFPHGPLVVQRPLNLGFDSPAPDGIPYGWFNSFGYVSDVSTDYVVRVVRRARQPADGMCVVLSKAPPSSDRFGSLMQRCPGRFAAGRAIRFEGELRTEGVSQWAGLWLRADADDHPNLFFDNMSQRPVTGTTDWAGYFIDAQLPANTDWLNYGIVLSGPGAVYADNLRLRIWTAEGTWEDV